MINPTERTVAALHSVPPRWRLALLVQALADLHGPSGRSRLSAASATADPDISEILRATVTDLMSAGHTTADSATRALRPVVQPLVPLLDVDPKDPGVVEELAQTLWQLVTELFPEATAEHAPQRASSSPMS